MSGKMFKDTETWSPATGCDHGCPYCSAYRVTFPRVAGTPKYKGGWTPTVHWDKVREGPPRTKAKYLFVCYMGDLFCGGFRTQDIFEVLQSCHLSSRLNDFLLLTKNSPRYLEVLGRWPELAQDRRLIWGVTIETTNPRADRFIHHLAPGAPDPEQRYLAMRQLRYDYPSLRMFLCLEPIMEFDLTVMSHWVETIRPEFVYIGYDNYGFVSPNLEPSVAKVQELINRTQTVTDWRLKTMREGGKE
jgi:DNA repair photolyase